MSSCPNGSGRSASTASEACGEQRECLSLKHYERKGGPDKSSPLLTAMPASGLDRHSGPRRGPNAREQSWGIRFPLALPCFHRVTGGGPPPSTTRKAPEENWPKMHGGFGLVRAQPRRVAPFGTWLVWKWPAETEKPDFPSFGPHAPRQHHVAPGSRQQLGVGGQHHHRTLRSPDHPGVHAGAAQAPGGIDAPRAGKARWRESRRGREHGRGSVKYLRSRARACRGRPRRTGKYSLVGRYHYLPPENAPHAPCAPAVATSTFLPNRYGDGLSR